MNSQASHDGRLCAGIIDVVNNFYIISLLSDDTLEKA